MTDASAGPRGRPSSPKVRPIHLDRRAVAYVRRPTPRQVAEPTCRTAAGRVPDGQVVEQFLAASTPAGPEVGPRAAEDLQAERGRLTGRWEQRPERARYQRRHAERQYQA